MIVLGWWLILVSVATSLMVIDRVMTDRDRIVLSGVVSVAVAVSFGVIVAAARGASDAAGYLAAYGAERLLSVDNVVALLAVVTSFGLQGDKAGRVWMWGLNLAVVLRVVMVLAGVGVVDRFWWAAPALGGLLALGGVRMLLVRTASAKPGGYGRLAKVLSRRGVPLVIVALSAMVAADVVFALDSVPTVVAFAPEPFAAVSAAVFSVLGLRSMVLLIGVWIPKLHYLEPALGLVLVLVGVKLAVDHVLAIPDWAALLAVGLVFGMAVLASLRRGPNVSALPPSDVPGIDSGAAIPRTALDQETPAL